MNTTHYSTFLIASTISILYIGRLAKTDDTAVIKITAILIIMIVIVGNSHEAFGTKDEIK